MLAIINIISMLSKIIRYSLLFLLAGTLMAYDMPKGWIAGGSYHYQYDYVMGVVKKHGQNVATIRSVQNEVGGYGSMVQRLVSDNYKGKRARLTGLLKVRNVDQWAGLLMRIECKTIDPVTGNEKRKVISRDNMYNRFVHGTAGYTKCEIVLDVPDTASDIEFGARLTGPGQIWFDQLKFEVVGKEVPVTSSDLKEPTNLEFEK